MHVIDLSHPFTSDMPVYPGSRPPVSVPVSRLAENGYLEHRITFYSHTGTHVDAPAHLIEGAPTIDQLPVTHFFGDACLLSLAAARCRSIGMDVLRPCQDALQAAEFLLIHTGWSRYWKDEAYFSGYPVLSPEAAGWLAGLGLKGIGLDTISADAADAHDLPVHHTLLRNNTLIIENLTNLDRLPAGRFAFSCFPLGVKGADGCPVRAVAYPGCFMKTFQKI